LRHEDAQAVVGCGGGLEGIRHGHEQAADHLAVALLARLRVFTPIVRESMTSYSSESAVRRRMLPEAVPTAHQERLVPRALFAVRESGGRRAAACAVANIHLLTLTFSFTARWAGCGGWPSIMNTGSMRSVP